MGCCQSSILEAKQLILCKKAKTEFQIPDIVIEEYVTHYNVDDVTKTDQEDYVWLTDSAQFPSEWFVHNCDRNTADYLLRDKPDGTFLVRESHRHKGNYVLAVSLHYFVHQLLIYKSDDGFGLLGNGIHPNLSSLITHYKQVSLKSKNQHLDTKLIKAIYASDTSEE